MERGYHLIIRTDSGEEIPVEIDFGTVNADAEGDSCIYGSLYGKAHFRAKSENATKKYRTEWTGKFPCLCTGEWKLYKNGRDVSEAIPPYLRNMPMNTRKKYKKYSTDGDVSTYKSGLRCSEWVDENEFWIKEIADTEVDYLLIYIAFNRNDFRPGSCGGCV